MCAPIRTPDSGPKKRTTEEWRKLAEEERRGTEQGLAFLDAVERDGCMAKVKPDSLEREVQRWEALHDGHTIACEEATHRRVCICGKAAQSVSLSLSLAQRILAVLELEVAPTPARLKALAAELRERMPK